MTQYIDKSAVIAEIERLRDDDYPCDTFEESTGYYNALDEIATFLNTLEVKEAKEEPISEELEEAANSCSSCIYLEEVLSDDDGEVLKERLVNTFKAGAKWQNDKACKWLKENKDHPLIGCEDPCLSGYLTDGFIEDFKKAMEE